MTLIKYTLFYRDREWPTIGILPRKGDIITVNGGTNEPMNMTVWGVIHKLGEYEDQEFGGTRRLGQGALEGAVEVYCRPCSGEELYNIKR